MELLEQLYNISSPSRKEKKMAGFIRQELDSMGVSHSTDKYGNIYATKGLSCSYPCIVSHMDEVHKDHSKGYSIVKVEDKLIFGYDAATRQHCGIGADDKNGIWICLKCLLESEALKCAFFVSEEIGCVGSNNADMTFFKDCRFVVQCDRRGHSDIVTEANMTELCSREFLRDISPRNFGFHETIGMLTDVVALKDRGLHVSCINISCGYYYPHSEHEFTDLGDLKKCLHLVRHIIRDCRLVYRHKKKEIRSSFFGYDSFYQENRIAGANKPFVVEYDEMYEDMSNILTGKVELTLDEIVNKIHRRYPQMKFREYENAYCNIMGFSS